MIRAQGRLVDRVVLVGAGVPHLVDVEVAQEEGVEEDGGVDLHHGKKRW